MVALTEGLETFPSAQHHADSRHRVASKIVSMAASDYPRGVTYRRNVRGKVRGVDLRTPQIGAQEKEASHLKYSVSLPSLLKARRTAKARITVANDSRKGRT